MQTTSFRHYLKAETRAEHEALDAHFAEVDLSSEAGLALFLRMQISALKTIEPLMQSATFAAPPPQLHLAIADLAQLGHAAPDAVPFAGSNPHPVGLIYVVAGSHFGARVLQKEWGKSTSARVQSAGSFLYSTDMKPYWAIFSETLADEPFGLEERNKICVTAKQCFATFRDALLFNQTHQGRE